LIKRRWRVPDDDSVGRSGSVRVSGSVIRSVSGSCSRGATGRDGEELLVAHVDFVAFLILWDLLEKEM
jgi:hypothetical protein